MWCTERSGLNQKTGEKSGEKEGDEQSVLEEDAE